MTGMLSSGRLFNRDLIGRLPVPLIAVKSIAIISLNQALLARHENTRDGRLLKGAFRGDTRERETNGLVT